MSESQSASTVYHIVLLKFLPDISKEDIATTCSNFTALANKCLTPIGEKYILSIHAGLNVSTEKADGGVTHGFVVLFKNLQDRDYYLEVDPVHIAFGRFVIPLLDMQGSRVVDFQDGKF